MSMPNNHDDGSASTNNDEVGITADASSVSQLVPPSVMAEPNGIKARAYQREMLEKSQQGNTILVVRIHLENSCCILLLNYATDVHWEREDTGVSCTARVLLTSSTNTSMYSAIDRLRLELERCEKSKVSPESQLLADLCTKTVTSWFGSWRQQCYFAGSNLTP